jgi:hypothetical protein
MNANSKDGKKDEKQQGRQPQAGSQRQQDPDSSQQQQDQGGQGQQYGEGNYKGTRDYNSGLKDHVEHHDIEREARDAAPRSAAEEKEMEEAERFARSKSRGEGGGPDDAEDEQELVK